LSDPSERISIPGGERGLKINVILAEKHGKWGRKVPSSPKIKTFNSCTSSRKVKSRAEDA
jgi:hypothetical protein